MNPQQKPWHLIEILHHVITNPIPFRMYQLTWIQNQVFLIIFCQIHLTRQTTILINEDNMWKRTKTNARIKHVLVTQSTGAQILQPHTNQKSIRSNWTRIHYRSGFIYYPSWIHLKLVIKNFRNIKVTYGLYIYKRGIVTRLC